MSEELADEVEAINSIYGDGSLVPAGEDTDMYILTLPADETAVSLRLQFPAEYPEAPPSVISTNSSGRRRGVASRDLELFRNVLGDVYQPGQVCLFDAIEELKRLQEEEKEREKEAARDHETTTAQAEAAPLGADAPLGPEPPWVISDPSVELRSTFVARCAAVTSPDQAEDYVEHLLATDKRLMDLWDTMIIVTRWYGGQKLGPRRFALINAVARDAFVKAGLVNEAPAGKKKGHGK
ncbi:hypothetical protein VMCG_04593 [Cytospora schulzeri]|uniref:RWD domain-containing protein n=1 Tax=Cytospora schulzeri TaxID=448051 RepID=A0A423WS35_9PEZI|nr:hypothetical protein VMCG_04593 [Valsa malicola]